MAGRFRQGSDGRPRVRRRRASRSRPAVSSAATRSSGAPSPRRSIRPRRRVFARRRRTDLRNANLLITKPVSWPTCSQRACLLDRGLLASRSAPPLSQVPYAYSYTSMAVSARRPHARVAIAIAPILPADAKSAASSSAGGIAHSSRSGTDRFARDVPAVPSHRSHGRVRRGG